MPDNPTLAEQAAEVLRLDKERTQGPYWADGMYICADAGDCEWDGHVERAEFHLPSSPGDAAYLVACANAAPAMARVVRAAAEVARVAAECDGIEPDTDLADWHAAMSARESAITALRAAEEEALVSGELSYQCPIWRCHFCDEVGDGENDLIDHMEGHVARLRGELAAMTTLVRRMAERQPLIEDSAQVVRGPDGCKHAMIDPDLESAQNADWADLCQLAGVEAKE